MKSSDFWDTTPCRPLKVNGHFGGTCRLHLHGRSSASYLVYADILVDLFFDHDDEVTCSSEASDGFQRTSWRYISEDGTLLCNLYSNLKY
jgi:hypothetical protein